MRFWSAILLFVVLGAAGAEDLAALRQRLHDAVVGQRVLTYKEVWEALVLTDPGREPGTVLLVYTRRNQDVLRRDRGQNDPDSWNREHLWPKSHGFPDEDNPAYTDLHNLRPADRSVNTQRGDRDFDEGGQPHHEATGVRWDADSWEVPDEVKGDVARAIFYMALRYDGSGTYTDRKGRVHREPRLQIVEGDSPETRDPLFGSLGALLRWNALDPPDEAERVRNSRVEAIQGRANPFVDEPQAIDQLWGSSD